jgi:putative methyltransferase (TIGR04325 family)
MIGETGRPPLAIWEGVYDSFAAAAPDVVGPGFAGDVWRARSLAQANACMAVRAAGRPLPSTATQRSALLPAVAAMMLHDRPRLRLLDFGGGLGLGFLQLGATLLDAERVDYVVIEDPRVCEEGRRLYGRRPAFLDTLPAGPVDLVHAASSLQYVEDWRGTLRALAALQPEYMLLSDLFIGPIPSFVSLQNYYGSRIAHWFWNEAEFLEACRDAGYTVLMRAPLHARRLGQDGVPMDSLPATHRIEQSSQVLLRSSTA